jgi:hypothetical protein
MLLVKKKGLQDAFLVVFWIQYTGLYLGKLLKKALNE